jgi:hypothetical protein
MTPGSDNRPYKTGAFCEIINVTTTTDEGEMLIYGAEHLQFLQDVHDEAVAAGETPQVPVITLEVIKASHLMVGLYKLRIQSS